MTRSQKNHKILNWDFVKIKGEIMATVASKTAVAKSNNDSGGLITAENQVQVIQSWSQALTELTKAQNTSLSKVETDFAVSIITNLTTRCIKSGINSNELNLTNFLEQVKHYSKLQLSINESELYLDIRNDKDTRLKTVTISRQYQGIQKLMRRYCTKKIVRFFDGIVCTGDTFETEDDFTLCITKIKKHIKNQEIDRSNLYNITYAYAIALVEEYGQLVPYTCIIDKKSILQARSCATTDKVWTNFTRAQVVKTAYWRLWKMMKPYIELPLGLQESFQATEDEMDFDKAQTPFVDNSEVYDIPSDLVESIPPIMEPEIVVDGGKKTSKPAVKKESEPDIDLGELPPNEAFEILWSEYVEHKEDYIKLDYNKETKMVLVKRK